ncbi:nucleotide exchange factor GrpE [Arachidicoccus ginsenosidivorans]|jgi:molecular chaperone GrpE|uniref:Protein GrpE n=1 Tax=Arachidicoccus ginsenosidivorans TaxID=496057 RepID=A0A5B8VJH4_9BACT|nr:nucleotide exchange factor GrpE [Arachidicoccus ginsenosidivorans]QEC71112.1 nucleotide exchange factor GrpE [Arachidicoccus ginsenosidivorans]
MSIHGKAHHEDDEKFQENQDVNTDNQSNEENQVDVEDGQTAPDAVISEAARLADALAEQKEKYIRLMAEFENYKRRTAKERIELIQTAGKDIIVSLLDVLDDCDRAEKQMNVDTDINHVREGSQLVFNKFRKILEAKGVKAMDSQGQDFDVETQEAIAEVPGTEQQSGKVIDVIQKGYLLNDKLIRFAKVVVGK